MLGGEDLVVIEEDNLKEKLFHNLLVACQNYDNDPEEWRNIIKRMFMIFGSYRKVDCVLETGGGCVEAWLRGATPVSIVRQMIVEYALECVVEWELEKCRQK